MMGPTQSQKLEVCKLVYAEAHTEGRYHELFHQWQVWVPNAAVS